MENQTILIDKPENMTSFGVVARVRRILSEKFGHKVKVGHTGTLDPFATGLLILMSGKNTKKCQDFLKLDKRYEATITLGSTSTTGDPEGEIFEHKINTPPSLTEVEKAVASFLGEITQVVPRFSAVKIDGRRAYDLARKGKEVEMPKRTVTIYELKVLDYSYPLLKISCHVSSGTYIRTLAEDIGIALGTGAYCSALRRTSIGEYNVKDALPLKEWMENPPCQGGKPVI